MVPTITTTIEPHTRIELQSEPEQFLDLEAGDREVKTEACCAPGPISDYDPERVLKALGVSFLLGGIVATVLCLAFSSNTVCDE